MASCPTAPLSKLEPEIGVANCGSMSVHEKGSSSPNAENASPRVAIWRSSAAGLDLRL